jgi:uncharacterized protein YqgC (DUF456 family)
MMFFGGWMIIIWVLIIALIVWGVIALVKPRYPSIFGGVTHR